MYLFAIYAIYAVTLFVAPVEPSLHPVELCYAVITGNSINYN